MPAARADAAAAEAEPLPPYVDGAELRGDGRSVFFETYGCQMNVSDSEIVQAVLKDAGYGLAETADAADVVLINTCAIRDGAEQKIWHRLRELRGISARRRRERREQQQSPGGTRLVVRGVHPLDGGCDHRCRFVHARLDNATVNLEGSAACCC